MGKKIGIVFLFVMMAVLVVLMRDDCRMEQAKHELYREMFETTCALNLQIYNLDAEVWRLEDESFFEDGYIGTTQFLVPELSELNYREIIAPMELYDYTVGLGLSLHRMPGEEACISIDTAKELLERNYYYCYAYDKTEAASFSDDPEEALRLWLSAVRDSALAVGINPVPAVYFPKDSFEPGFEAVVKACGIKVVIHYGEAGGTYLMAHERDSVWYVNAVWWLHNEIIANKLGAISRSGGEFVTIMEFVTDGTTHGEWMQEYIDVAKKVSVQVTDLEEMMEIQSDNKAGHNHTLEDRQRRIREAKEQVAELKREIYKIEQAYWNEVQNVNRTGIIRRKGYR